jgi:hypothetical protein
VRTNGGVEACDGLDNDCDGETDETFPGLGESCQHGACPTGAWVCAPDGLGTRCDGPLPAADDATCDGLDDDCDGETDEDAPARPCPLQEGVCAGAVQRCQGGRYTACDYGPLHTPGVDATCDQRDDDCDGLTDEDALPLLVPELGGLATDGLDNNCNGLIDEPGGVLVPIPGYSGVWIDAFETTVFERADCSGARYGLGSDDYPPGWPAAFEPAAEPVLYACSLPGVVPSGHLSYHRSLRACLAQGKRLCNREQFVRACTAGLSQDFPYGFRFAPGICNDPSVIPGQPEATGSRAGCTAGQGAYDMSGNLTEWVSDDSQQNPGYGVVASWSYDRRACWNGVGCYTLDPARQDELDLLLVLLDCNVENRNIDSYPRETTRPSFGGRCCYVRP